MPKLKNIALITPLAALVAAAFFPLDAQVGTIYYYDVRGQKTADLFVLADANSNCF